MDRRATEFNDVLFSWSDESYRVMDWRPKHRDTKKMLNPYKILVSELMLQQTQVERVRAKYKAFLKRFPRVDTLAEAPLSEVLKLWSGLGYNRRAKYLHQAAKQVVHDYNGKFPRDFVSLQLLPGIGRSTAAAIMAFAWNEPYAMIDTNLRRILTRSFFNGQIPSDAVLLEFAISIIPSGRGRAWNYAMLDLGAMVCTARRHRDACPMFDFHGDVSDFVYKKPQTKFKGSKRSCRGALLRELVKRGKLSCIDAENFFTEAGYDGKQSVDELIAEGMIIKSKTKITLAE